MKIYLDVCCLNRPFDDHGQAKIYLESEARAKTFEKGGLAALDALHLAVAETGKADYFLSVDNKITKRAKRVKTYLKVRNPVD